MDHMALQGEGTVKNGAQRAVKAPFFVQIGVNWPREKYWCFWETSNAN